MKFIPSQASLPATALTLDNSQDVLALSDTLRTTAVVVLQFPKWTDGRAYSQAVLLRSRLRFGGEIRAQGEVLADMLPMLQRCGFDAVQLRADQRLDVAQRALAYFGQHYQQVPPERQAASADELDRLDAAVPRRQSRHSPASAELAAA